MRENSWPGNQQQLRKPREDKLSFYETSAKRLHNKISFNFYGSVRNWMMQSFVQTKIHICLPGND